MEKKKIRSVVPVYAAAAAWLIFALQNPMFELSNILISLGVSAAAYGAARLIFRPKLLELEAPKETPELPPEPEGPCRKNGAYYIRKRSVCPAPLDAHIGFGRDF